MAQKYVCPGCGKSYSTLDQIARCVQADSNKQKQAEENTRLRQEAAQKAQDARKALDAAYITFRRAVNAYNTAAKQAEQLDNRGVYPRAVSSLTYNTAFSTVNTNKDKLADAIKQNLNCFAKELVDAINKEETKCGTSCSCKGAKSMSGCDGDLEGYLRGIFGF